MNQLKNWLGTVVAGMCIAQALAAEDNGAVRDWADLAAYRAANTTLGAPAPGENRVVFMGDSITEFWDKGPNSLFSGKAYINRGISGQTTPQMLVRFRQDVIDLKPKAVVILAGTNDLAGNTGPTTLEAIEGNIASMAELARAHGIRVVLASVLPAASYPWSPSIRPAPQIVALNRWLKAFAEPNGFVYLDYHSAMVDAQGGLKRSYSEDGVHPNAAGYRVMEPLAEQAISAALHMN